MNAFAPELPVARALLRLGLLSLAVACGTPDAARVEAPSDLPDPSVAPEAVMDADADAEAQAARAVFEPLAVERTVDDWLRDAASEAEAVLVGTVVDITYGASAPDHNGDILPHTWVTWRLEGSFKGQPAGSIFTGRFIGGPTPDRRHMLQVSGMPQFDLGDRDVLFVTHNGEWACPLVEGAAGRLRVIGGAVYTDDGRPFGLEAGLLTLGPPAELEEVRSTTIAGRTFRVEGDPSPIDPASVAFEPASVRAVLAHVADVTAAFPSDAPVIDADPDAVFVIEMEDADRPSDRR